MQQTPRRLSLLVEPVHTDKRVDTLLRHELHLSGTAVRRAKRISGGILLDACPAHTNERVQLGQVLSVQIGDPPNEHAPEPEPGDLHLVYEDEDVLILDKPAPLAVHPGPTHHGETLANFLRYYYQSIGLVADVHPVSRLDRGTSGLMAVAKHAHAHERMAADLHTEQAQRLYLAICEGIPQAASGCVDAPIARLPGEVLKRGVMPDGAKARTQYETLRVQNGRALVQLRLETGRTHQIRVHMAHLGTPLVGDFLYGRESAALPDRFALHAHVLQLRHPLRDEMLRFVSPLPEALAALLDTQQKGDTL